MRSSLDKFCGGQDHQFWDDGMFTDPNITRPEVTPCFQHTALVWLPVLITFLISPVLLRKLAVSTKHPLPLKAALLAKIILAICICLVCVFLVVLAVVDGSSVNDAPSPSVAPYDAPVLYTYPALLLLAFTYLLYLTFMCKRRGIVTSGCIFLSLVAFCVCGVGELQWWLSGDAHTEMPLRFAAFVAYYSLLLALTFAHSFADEPAAEDKPKDDKACPELSSSFPNQMTFWWFTALAWTGYRRPLTADDLWSINDRDRSARLSRRWDGYWDKAMTDYQRRVKIMAAKETEEKKNAPVTETEVRLNAEDEVQFIKGEKKEKKKKKVTVVAQPSILVVLAKCLYGTLIPAVCMKFVYDTLAFAGPQLLKGLIRFVGDPTAPLWQGLFFAICMFLVAMMQSFLLHQYFHRMFRVGMNIKAILTAAVFNKTLRLSNAARRERTVGEITNLMSVDTQRFVDISTFGMLYFSAPLQIALAIFFLWQELGPSVLAGLAVLLLMIPINFLLTMKMRRLQAEQMKHKDERLKMMNEVLNGIKVLKLYAWEPSMEQLVQDIRKKEIIILRKVAYLNAVTTLTWASAPFLVAVMTFAAFVLSSEENILTPDKTFVALALFNILRFPMSMLASLIGQTVMLNVSNKRLKAFLAAEQLDPHVVDRTLDISNVDASLPALEIRKGTFTWEEDKPTLHDINIVVPRGQLVAVVGKVGCGKSSLLSALLGEMGKSSGGVTVRGSISYVPQLAWIQNLTLQENISFDTPFEQSFYDKVIDACALRADFDILPGGDQTEIGEKGINLSGGQKQRVSLARGVYQHRDIYLLDDPLSAVDAHVGRHIFDNVIGKEGMLGDKTRILVTHGLQYLQRCDSIIVMKEGRVSETGSYAELMKQKGDFADFLEEHLIEEVKLHKKRRITSDSIDEDEEGNHDELDTMMQELCKYDPSKRERLQQQMSFVDEKKSPSITATRSSKSPTKSLTSSLHRRSHRVSTEKDSATRKPMEQPTGKEELKKLIQTEQTETGKVQWRVYRLYVRAIGYVITSLFIVTFILSAVLGVASNIWLANWADANEAKANNGANWADANEAKANNGTESYDTSTQLGVYAALGIGQALAVCLASLIIALGMVFASMKLHSKLVHNLMQSPMSFFDTTPLGRILNRVGKDIDTLDSTLPMTIRMFTMCIVGVVCTLFVIIYATPWFAVVLPPLFIFYIFALDIQNLDFMLPMVFVAAITLIIQAVIHLAVICIPTPITIVVMPPIAIIYFMALRFYVSTSRQLKRIVSVSLSPIYSHFQETVQGAVSIRAYNAGDRFMRTSEKRVDNHLMCHYPTLVANRWLAIRLEFVGNCIVLSAAVFAVMFRDSGTLTAGLVGLSISYALNITQTLNWAVRMTSDLEANIVSVERITEYSESPTEAAWASKPERKPPASWPSKGVIQFSDFATRYREGMDLVLDGINATINAKEKVGIVGRTGAGKSSLTLCLFRIIEPARGRITIDGVDISEIGLHDLRERLTIIPQDPVLFSGSLRMNLDPFDVYSDADIWRALEQAHLKAYVDSLAGKLMYDIAEGGENMSVGQRQLLCLARALLRKTKVLIMDEATAAVDVETDALIQTTIRTQFADCTILTIAHRLNTVLDNDRVMVLRQGKIAEFDTPQRLMDDGKSIFHGMCEEAGIIKA